LGELVGAGYRDKRDYQELVGLEYNYRPGVFQPAVTKAPSNDQLKKQVDEIQLGRARTVEEVSALQSELTTLRAEKAAADQRFQALEADYQNVLVTRVAAVEADKQRAEQEVSELKGQITQLQQEKNAVEQRFSVLEKNVSELNQLRTNVEPIVNAAQPVSSIEGVAAEDLAILERNNIRTVGQLAEVDTSRLTELGINRNAATSMVKQAGDRVRIKSP
jgi:chromosome segregation ATPase